MGLLDHRKQLVLIPLVRDVTRSAQALGSQIFTSRALPHPTHQAPSQLPTRAQCEVARPAHHAHRTAQAQTARKTQIRYRGGKATQGNERIGTYSSESVREPISSPA